MLDSWIGHHDLQKLGVCLLQRNYCLRCLVKIHLLTQALTHAFCAYCVPSSHSLFLSKKRQILFKVAVCPVNKHFPVVLAADGGHMTWFCPMRCKSARDIFGMFCSPGWCPHLLTFLSMWEKNNSRKYLLVSLLGATKPLFTNFLSVSIYWVPESLLAVMDKAVTKLESFLQETHGQVQKKDTWKTTIVCPDNS